MAIIVRHGSGTGTALVGAYGSGQGKRRAEDTRQATAQIASAAESRKQRQHATRQATEQRGFMLERDEAGRRFAAERDEAQRTFTTERDEAQRTFTTERDEAGRAFTVGRDVAARSFTTHRDRTQWTRGRIEREHGEHLRRAGIEWGYSARQRAEWDQINVQIDAVQNDNTLTDEEKAEGIRQLRDRQYGIQRQPRMPDDGPSPQEQFEQSTFTSEDGVVYGQDRSGAWRVIRDPQQGEQQRRQRERQQAERDIAGAVQRIQARDDTRDPGSIDPEEIREEIRRHERLIEEIMGQGSEEEADEQDAFSKHPEDPDLLPDLQRLAEDMGISLAEAQEWYRNQYNRRQETQ